MNATQPITDLLAQALQQMLDLATGGEDLPAITVPAAATASAPALLANGPGLKPVKGRSQMASRTAAPAHAQADNAKLYSRCLALYRDRLQAGAEADDLGRAAALFVMANLNALGRQLAPGSDTQALAALTQQMQNALQRLPNWPTTDLAARQQMFEQLAILSVLVTQTNEAAAKQGPIARANVRAAAQTYLRQWLAVDPALLSLSPAGLVSAGSASETLARRVKRELAA
jgi:hypothetical protein